MARLSVNVDHVATVREARGVGFPDPVTAALTAEMSGATGITIHLREDRRHIQDRDLALLRNSVQTELNLEMAATEEMVSIALEKKPDMVTIVPERREELTTEGGLDVKSFKGALRDVTAKLKGGFIRVNLFVDPTIESIKAAHAIDADGIELHTGHYANLPVGDERSDELKRIADAAMLARKLGLKVHAGHGLDYLNVADVRKIGEIEEFAIGFSIIARSVFVGIERAVREMAELVK